jgi:vancomycin aglycone glucosyltransferase
LMQLRELYRAAKPHIPEIIDAMDRVLAGADLLVSSYLFPMNRAIAERRGIKFATFAFAHNTVPSRYYPPEGVPRLRYFPRLLQHIWNRWTWRLVNVAVDTTINLTIARQLRARQLPAVRNFFSRPAELVLVAVSSQLMRPPFHLHPRFRFVGFSRWQAPVSDRIERELGEFTGGQPVPVLTFGSMVYQQPETWMRRLAATWPADQKLVVQRGWAGFAALDGCPHIRVIEEAMSHEQLFRHASVVIHHGGAGTTASVLAAGRPHIVVPHIADQNFFAHEIRRLGCGVRLGKAHWPEQLAAAVRRVHRSEAMHATAARAAQQMGQEDGPGIAVREMERFVASAELVEMPA